MSRFFGIALFAASLLLIRRARGQLKECLRHSVGFSLFEAIELESRTAGSVGECLDVCFQHHRKCRAALFVRRSAYENICTIFANNTKEGIGLVVPSIDSDDYNLYEKWEECDLTSHWGQWTSWSPCEPAHCSSESRTRSRDCLSPTCATGEDFQTDECRNANECVYFSSESLAVHRIPAQGFRTPKVFDVPEPKGSYGMSPPRFESWTSWSKCSATCGLAFKTRTRNCFNCPGPQKETQSCGGRPCSVWGQWEGWSSCSSSCGAGMKIRGRQCKNGFFCVGSRTKASDCNLGACQAQQKWTQWSACSATCGNAESTRHKRCETPGYCPSSSSESRPCQLQPCDHLSRWSGWSTCAGSCGEGHRERRRSCLNGYFCVGPTKEMETCSLAPCPAMTQWSEWSCSVTCGSGKATRSRACSSGYCSSPTTETKVCDREPCPPPCRFTHWSEWSHCSASCGGGQSERKRKCTCGFRYGYGCPGPEKENKTCNAKECGAWSEWTIWSDCSTSCSKGSQERSRFCSIPGRCEGKSVSSKICDLGPCQTCSWNDWTPCSKTCDSGIRHRSQICSGNSYGSGEREEEECSLGPCPNWLSWGSWTDCSATCGNGSVSERTRLCSHGSLCGDDHREQKPCQLKPCSYWSEWEAWGACSASCGNGTATRTRNCSHGNDCQGDSVETRDCGGDPCPEWEPWSPFSACSKTCGDGVKTKHRGCSYGSSCDGEKEEKSPCHERDCPRWSSWDTWSTCSATCGEGSKRRTRLCLDGEEGECEGAHEETGVCEIRKNCLGYLGSWSQWTSCSASQCGTQKRTRGCVNGPKGCDSGAKEESRKCGSPCLEWNDWGPCQPQCGEGVQKRTVKCQPSYECGKSETRRCNNGPCSWQAWSQYGPCAATCGPSVRKRTRQCVIPGGCEGQDNETTPCSNGSCPKWLTWEQWSQCRGTCGKEVKYRSRGCTHGALCSGHKTESLICNTRRCLFPTPIPPAPLLPLVSIVPLHAPPLFPVPLFPLKQSESNAISQTSKVPPHPVRATASAHCAWSDWLEWGSCSVTCGDGRKARTRECSCSDSADGRQRCEGPAKLYTWCEERANCEGIGFSAWGAWSQCSASCDKAFKIRKRVCVDRICEGSELEEVPCDVPACDGSRCRWRGLRFLCPAVTIN